MLSQAYVVNQVLRLLAEAGLLKGESDRLPVFARKEEVHQVITDMVQHITSLWDAEQPDENVRAEDKCDGAERTKLPFPTSPGSTSEETADIPFERTFPMTSSTLEPNIGQSPAQLAGAQREAREDRPATIDLRPIETASGPALAAEQSNTSAGNLSEAAQPRKAPALPAPPTPPTGANPIRQFTSPMSFVFVLPNAKAGQRYSGTISGGPVSAPKSFRGMRMPEGLGLTFDDATGTLIGVPLKDGEHDMSFQWSVDSVEWRSGACKLLVNPDPRTLWKNIAPPADGPYIKSNAHGETLDGKGIRLTAASRRGRSHEHQGSFRDDDFDLRHDPETGWSVLTVADGAGSAKHSREGARLACANFGNHLISALTAESGRRIVNTIARWDADSTAAAHGVGLEFHHLFYNAAKSAVLAIEAEADQQGGTARDYATTLLVAAVRRSGAHIFVATFWIGDGAIAVYGPAGRLRLMGVPDGGDFAGQTRFLDRAAITDAHFSKRQSVGRYEDVNAVLLMTDGVSDPIFQTDQGLADPKLWDALWSQLSPSLAEAAPDASLIEWLDFFTPGHHDDRTIALLWPA